MTDGENLAKIGWLVQVGWIMSDEFAAEYGVSKTDDNYILTIEMAERDGGILPKFADRLIPVYRLADGK